MPNETRRDEAIRRFERNTIRSHWDDEQEKWFFSIVDVVIILMNAPDYLTGRKYWNKLKQRLKEEGSELVTNCHQLKLQAADGKLRLTDVADTEQLLRLIQSIPSPKAEPFKMWLAQVGNERIEETVDPELTIDRAFETYLKKGYSLEWMSTCFPNALKRNGFFTRHLQNGHKKSASSLRRCIVAYSLFVCQKSIQFLIKAEHFSTKDTVVAYQ